MTTNKRYDPDEYIEALPFLEKILGGPLTFAEILLVSRESRDWSQAKLASVLGITRAHLCDLEKQRRFVSPRRASDFAKILQDHEGQFVRVALEDLLRRSELPWRVELIAD